MAEVDDWNWKTTLSSGVGVTSQDARFILAACCQWVPDDDMTRIIRWDAPDYEQLPILHLVKKVLPLLAVDATPEQNIDLSIGEISFILHYLRGDDSYGGGARFEKALLKALHDLLIGGE